MSLFHVLAKKCVCYYCKLIKSNVYKKYSITARELVFTILDRSVSCLFDNTFVSNKKKRQA